MKLRKIKRVSEWLRGEWAYSKFMSAWEKNSEDQFYFTNSDGTRKNALYFMKEHFMKWCDVSDINRVYGGMCAMKLTLKK